MSTRELLAIDPGTTHSALVVFEADGSIRSAEILDNEAMRARLYAIGHDHTRATGEATGVYAKRPPLALEMVASYGMAVGREVFETCVWIGKFAEVWDPGDVFYVYRRDVKLHLCGSARAKDGNIRQALIDRFGGSREAAIGTKKKPGPLYGIRKDLWAALAVGVTYEDTRQRRQAA